MVEGKRKSVEEIEDDLFALEDDEGISEKDLTEITDDDTPQTKGIKMGLKKALSKKTSKKVAKSKAPRSQVISARVNADLLAELESRGVDTTSLIKSALEDAVKSAKCPCCGQDLPKKRK